MFQQREFAGDAVYGFLGFEEVRECVREILLPGISHKRGDGDLSVEEVRGVGKAEAVVGRAGADVQAREDWGEDIGVGEGAGGGGEGGEEEGGAGGVAEGSPGDWARDEGVGGHYGV